MSLDTEVYAAKPSTLNGLRGELPENDSWVHDDSEISYDGGGWQVLVWEPEEIDPGDVPAHLAALLPDPRYRISITLEPIGAKEAYGFFASVVESVAIATEGVTTDPRSGHARRYGT